MMTSSERMDKVSKSTPVATNRKSHRTITRSISPTKRNTKHTTVKSLYEKKINSSHSFSPYPTNSASSSSSDDDNEEEEEDDDDDFLTSLSDIETKIDTETENEQTNMAPKYDSTMNKLTKVKPVPPKQQQHSNKLMNQVRNRWMTNKQQLPLASLTSIPSEDDHNWDNDFFDTELWQHDSLQKSIQPSSIRKEQGNDKDFFIGNANSENNRQIMWDYLDCNSSVVRTTIISIHIQSSPEHNKTEDNLNIHETAIPQTWNQFQESYNHSFQININHLLQRENEMKRISQKSSTQQRDGESWSNSLIMMKLKASRKRGNLSFYFNPQMDLSNHNLCTKKFVWTPGLTKCLSEYYSTGRIHIYNSYAGRDIVLALQYFRILFTPDQVVFDTFASYLRVKIWTDYYRYRRSMASWIISRLVKLHSRHSYTFVASPESTGPFYIGGRSCELFHGGLQEKDANSWTVVHDLFSDDDEEDILNEDESEIILLREDFKSYLLKKLPGTHITFSREEVNVSPKTPLDTVYRPVLRIYFDERNISRTNKPRASTNIGNYISLESSGANPEEEARIIPYTKTKESSASPSPPFYIPPSLTSDYKENETRITPYMTQDEVSTSNTSSYRPSPSSHDAPSLCSHTNKSKDLMNSPYMKQNDLSILNLSTSSPSTAFTPPASSPNDNFSYIMDPDTSFDLDTGGCWVPKFLNYRSPEPITHRKSPPKKVNVDSLNAVWLRKLFLSK